MSVRQDGWTDEQSISVRVCIVMREGRGGAKGVGGGGGGANAGV